MSGTRRLQGNKLHLSKKYSAVGFVGLERGIELYGEQTLICSFYDAKSDNILIVEGRLEGDSNWIEIASLSNELRNEIDISKYDFIRFNALKVDIDPAKNSIHFIASGFFSLMNPAGAVLEQLQKNEKALIKALCVQERMLERMETLLLHIGEMTDEEF